MLPNGSRGDTRASGHQQCLWHAHSRLHHELQCCGHQLSWTWKAVQTRQTKCQSRPLHAESMRSPLAASNTRMVPCMFRPATSTVRRERDTVDLAAAVLGRRQPRARRRVEHAHVPVEPYDATRPPSGENETPRTCCSRPVILLAHPVVGRRQPRARRRVKRARTRRRRTTPRDRPARTRRPRRCRRRARPTPAARRRVEHARTVAATTPRDYRPTRTRRR